MKSDKLENTIDHLSIFSKLSKTKKSKNEYEPGKYYNSYIIKKQEVYIKNIKCRYIS